MNQPTITVLIPTAGRDTLAYSLQTIAQQELVDGDEVLIIGDGAQKDVEAQIEAIGKPFRYIEGPHTNDWGHTQINLGLGLARADWIMVTDDDDAYLPRAFEVVRRAIVQNPGRPHLFRFFTNDKHLVWRSSDHHHIDETLIGSHNLVIPNDPERRGEGGWTERYRGDLDWVRAVLDSYPRRDWIWRPEILSRQRPQRDLATWAIRNPEQREAFVRLKGSEGTGWRCLFSARDEVPFAYIGWAELTEKGGRMTLKHGLGEEFQNKGYAAPLLGHMIDAGMGDIWVELPETERKSLHIHREMGFVEKERKDGIIHLWHEYPPV